MARVRWWIGVAAICAMMTSSAHAVTPTSVEQRRARQWTAEHVERDRAVFSFRYGADRADVAGWEASRTDGARDASRVRRTTTWRDPQTKLTVRCESVEYSDVPVVEWTVYLKNEGPSDTPLIADLRAIDLPIPGAGDTVLHHNVGSPNTPTDYRPLTTPLAPGQSKRITTAGGRSTNSDLPFFNLAGQGGGTIVALGWPGQWSAEFTRAGDAIRVVAGQELTHFVLHPGEEVRTPLVALLFYDGDVARGQNLWRRWMLAHNVPRIAGKLPPPQTNACSSHQVEEMMKADEANQKLFVDRYLEEGIKLDYWWMDAGWYPQRGAWWQVGTWEVDRTRFPNGLRAITDHARANGVKSILWFEPERVHPGTKLYVEHPEFLLGPDGGDKLLDLGNPAALKWWVDRADQIIREQGIDLYRTDYNFDPLGHWRGNDKPDRQGITEIRYVVGLLEYWDELRRRHPDMLIDTCASGGRRNDLEVLRRAVPLLRSDYILEPIGQQLHTYGIASWIPFYGTGMNSPDPYHYRSQWSPSQTMCFDVRRKDLDYDAIRKRWREWRSVADCYYGDFYPLTPYSPEPTAWIGWQFDLPEQSRGFVQAFRRAECPETQIRLKLHGLDPAARYNLRDLDRDGTQVLTGKELADEGLLLDRDERPASIVITYQRAE